MCNESMIKKLQNVTIKIDRTTQRQMIDLANRIKDNFSFQHWDEIVVCLSDTLGHYANTKSIAPVNGLLNAEITHALTHRGERYGVVVCN